MKTPEVAYIVPAHADNPAALVILRDGEVISHTMTLNTMTKLLVQLAGEIKHVVRPPIPR